MVIGAGAIGLIDMVLRPENFNFSGFSVHPDPVSVCYQFYGILIIFEIDNGGYLQYSAGNACAGVDPGEDPALGGGSSHTGGAKVAGPSIGPLAPGHYQDLLPNGTALVDVAMLPDDAGLRIDSRPAGNAVRAHQGLPFDDAGDHTASLDN